MNKVIDITDLVEKLRSAFVETASSAVFAAALALPGMGWLATPFVSFFAKKIIGGVVWLVSELPMMGGFFLNTAIRKSSQAGDFVDATHELDNLPDTCTDEEYANAENKKSTAFYNLVVLGN